MAREPKFKCGDLVQHRASKERAVVVRIKEGCISHRADGWICSSACTIGFRGEYLLSTGLGRNTEGVEDQLELVEENSPARETRSPT